VRSFRLIADLTHWSADTGAARWRPGDLDLGAERPPTVPGILVLEALVQCAGLLLQRTDPDPTTFWMLVGVDDADVGVVQWDDEITMDCVIRQRTRRAATVVATAVARDLRVCRSGLLMAYTARSEDAGSHGPGHLDVPRR
jgi:hypothetical protein